MAGTGIPFSGIPASRPVYRRTPGRRIARFISSVRWYSGRDKLGKSVSYKARNVLKEKILAIFAVAAYKYAW
jgi:hypothetical protein